jgi:hypothetical protein
MLFTKLYHQQVYGVIEGLDRIRFRGTERMLSNLGGFARVLSRLGVLLKDFGAWAETTTKRLRACCDEQADMLGIPVRYLRCGGVDKDALARQIAREEGVSKDGSICMLSVVETCLAPTVVPNRASKHLEVQMRPRRCLFIYYYFDHPQVGFGHVRLQTWAPYGATICLNGRHWLEKLLLANGVDHLKVGNCFPWVADVAAAQKLMDAQLQTNWPELLDGLVLKMCPVLPGLCMPFEIRYYWSAEETEFATDVMFRSKAVLDALFPKLVLYGMRVSDCRAVLRYFAKRSADSSCGCVPDQIMSDCRRRHEGVRIKHWVNGDSVKMYNKEGVVLRVETTINNARNFKAFRSANDDPSKPCTWQKMRKGVSDLHRRCEVSRNSNARYLDAMGTLQVEKTLHEVAAGVCNRTSVKGRTVRGLNPWNALDFKLLTFLAKGEWAVNGFRNKTLCRWLESKADTLPAEERKRLSAKATRLMGMLRAHGLIRKMARENRYVLTQKGQLLAGSLLVASGIEIKQLTEMAA